MAPLVTEVSARMVDSLEQYATEGEELDLRVLFAKYTMDSLASCAFGVNAKSFSGTKTLCPYHHFHRDGVRNGLSHHFLHERPF